MARTNDRLPISVAVLNDHELVVHGLAAMLAEFKDRVTVVDATVDARDGESVDIVFYDDLSVPSAGEPWSALLGRGWDPTHVVRYTWQRSPGVADPTTGALPTTVVEVPKSLTGAALVDAIEQIHATGAYAPSDADRAHVVAGTEAGTPERTAGRQWPGQAAGLTERESDIVCLVVAGLSNEEIAARTFLGVNTIKTHIRTAYRTMGVTSRTKAVLWGIDHGLRPYRPPR